MEDSYNNYWVLSIVYGSDEIDNTETIESPYNSRREAFESLRKLIAEITEDNKNEKNNDGMYLVSAKIRFSSEIKESLLEGATWKDVRRGN